MTEEMLEVVDENDNVIGITSRKEIHEKGLPHREIHVWFVTPKGEEIFQRRGKTKDTYPGLLDVTVGGHVEIGDSYEETAVKEILEETGLKVDISQLIPIHKRRSHTFDDITKMQNNASRMVYAYIFDGSIDKLTVEANAADGFSAYPIEQLLQLPKEDQLQFIPTLVDKENYGPTYQKLLALVKHG